MKLLAVIFDLDGTIIDSERQWSKAFTDTLETLGKKVNDPHPEEFGVSLENNWKNILKKYKIITGKTVEELGRLTYRNYIKYIGEVGLFPGALDFIKRLTESGVKIGLATSSEWWVVEKIFDNLGLADFFDATVTGEETLNKKPFPDPLILAADKLGFEPGECLAVGDSPSDIEAAHSAGMKVIVVTQKNDSEANLKNANLVVEGFSDITPEAIDRL